MKAVISCALLHTTTHNNYKQDFNSKMRSGCWCVGAACAF